MKRFKIQGHASLRKEMKAVARGERLAPKDAGGTTFDSVEALLRLLTRQNRELLAIVFVRLKNVDRRKVPTTTIHALRINIDPFSRNDRLELV